MSQDTRRLIIGMMLALGVIVAYNWFLHWKYPGPWTQPQTQPTTATSPTTLASGTQPAATRSATTTPSAGTQAVVSTAPSQPVWRAAGGPATQKVLGSSKIEDSKYRMQIETVARGGAINGIVLNEFRKTTEDKQARYSFQHPYELDHMVREDARSMISRWISVNGNVVDLSNVAWRVEESSENHVQWVVDIVRGDEKPVARVHKTYRLSSKNGDPKTDQGWEVMLTYRVENLTDQPQVIKASFDGPVAPPNELERQPDQNLVAGFWNDGKIVVEAKLIESALDKDKPTWDFTKSEKGLGMVWAGMQSAYFNALVRPVPLAANDPAAGWIAKARGELLNPGTANSTDRRAVMRFDTADFTVPAGQTTQFALETYFGPKKRDVLNTAYYDLPPRSYSETLVVASSGQFCGWICAWCNWPWLINGLVILLGFFYKITWDWGLAIILLVVLVRAILHPITKKSQVQMVKFQKMGPELEKLKQKYKDDKEAFAREQMKFYKENGAAPLLGCLPMLLQMPIWIALWNTLQSTFELRLSPFLYGLTWIQDLAKPDYLVKFSQPIPVFCWTISGINLLPILMGVVFYLQSKLQPTAPTMTPEQAQQQKMMTWMSTLMFPLLLYSGPSGLNLYILTSTAFGIVESKVIRKHIKEREALEAKLGPTIIDAPPPDKDKKSAKGEPVQKGWLQRLMDKAEELKKQAEHENKKKKKP